MDPVSHAVIGRALAAAVVKGPSRQRGVAAASVLGALSPDVDCLLMPAGWDIYLRWHVIGTHSAAGALLTGLGSALLVRVFVRGSALKRLSIVAVLGALSHLAADMSAGARLQPGWPIAGSVVSAPLVAMGDPWAIVLLLAGSVALWRARPRLQRAARATLLALTMFLALKGVVLAFVLRGAAASTRIDQASRIVEARWASLTDWFVFDRRDAAVRQWRVSAGAREPELLLSVPEHEESPLVLRSRAFDTVRNFLEVHDLGFATEADDASGRRTVLWSDVRFCWRTDAIPRVACALWFGGVFDPAGRPVRQEVRVGSWIQSRAP